MTMASVAVVRDRVRAAPLAATAAVAAWCAAIALTVLLVPGTLLFVVPPAIVATVALVVPPARRPTVSAVTAVLLGAWAIVGFTLLGGYFVPSAVLLAVDAVRSRS